MGDDSEHWAGQLENDLENLYFNENLKITGVVSHPTNPTKFKLVMYQVEIYERTKKFDFVVEPLYDKISPTELQNHLNDKYFNEGKILRSLTTVYKSDIEGDSVTSSKIIRQHLLIYQNLKVNTSSSNLDQNIMFIVVSMPKLDRKKDPSDYMQNFMKDMYRKKGLYLLSVVTNTRMSDSYLVFMRKECEGENGQDADAKDLTTSPIW